MPKGAAGRLPWLGAGAMLLVIALWAGLARLGWRVPPLAAHHPLAHGPLMIGGFLGTLIGLEKAVALGRGWGYLAPSLAAAGGLWAAISPDPEPAAWALAAAAAVLAAVFAALLRRRVDLAAWVMLAGAGAWLAGNLLWASGRPLPALLPWWAAFPLLTIVGERLELSRLVAPPRSALPPFVAALALYGLGLVYLPLGRGAGIRLLGAALLLLCAWLLRYDLARRTVRFAGFHRYTALCLLSGYAWLGLAGGMALAWGAELGGLRYDALLHALFLGFVFGMIFGHAPIIFPILSAGRRLPWSPLFYAPLILLQVSLALRLAGDLAGWLPGRSWGGLGNAAAILLFLANTLRAALASSRPSA